MCAKKKILLIDNSLYTTGAILSALEISDQLKDRYTFIYILPQKSNVFDLIKDRGFEVIGLPMLEINKSYRILFYLPKLCLNAIRLLRIINQKQIDIVHINDIYNMLGVVLKIIHPRIKIVYAIRLLKTSYIAQMYSTFATLVKRFADNIFCVSGAVQKDFGGFKYPEVIYTAIVLENLPPWNGLNDPQKLSVLYIGNYMKGKGQHWAVYAIAEVARVYPLMQLTFVGGCNDSIQEEFKKELQLLATELNVSKNLIFKGPTNEVEAVMKTADVILNLSESESFSRVCLDALNYGIPLIASDCGGPSEITDNGRQAFLIPNKDFRAAAAALIQIIENPENARYRAMCAKEYARNKFSPDIAKLALQRIYG